MFKRRKRIDPVLAETVPEPPAPVLPLAEPGNDLLKAQVRILCRDSRLTIVDAGAQNGHTSAEYLDAFPNCRVIALEPASSNFALSSRRLADYGERARLMPLGLSDHVGRGELHLTSHSGSHFLLTVNDVRYFDSPIWNVGREDIETVTLDQLCAQAGIETLDILKMDIQGGELMALQGARAMLERGAIKLIASVVLFPPLYNDQPTFWDIESHLRRHGYAFHGLYDVRYHDRNPAVLRWADAIFVAPSLVAIPDKE